MQEPGALPAVKHIPKVVTRVHHYSCMEIPTPSCRVMHEGITGAAPAAGGKPIPSLSHLRSPTWLGFIQGKAKRLHLPQTRRILTRPGPAASSGPSASRPIPARPPPRHPSPAPSRRSALPWPRHCAKSRAGSRIRSFRGTEIHLQERENEDAGQRANPSIRLKTCKSTCIPHNHRERGNEEGLLTRAQRKRL